jgi:hypothetical protein
MIFESYAHNADECPKSGFLGYFSINHESDDESAATETPGSSFISSYSQNEIIRSITDDTDVPVRRRMLMLNSYGGYDTNKETKKVSFSDSCEIYITFALSEYDRRPCTVNKRKRRRNEEDDFVCDELIDSSESTQSVAEDTPSCKTRRPEANETSTHQPI